LPNCSKKFYNSGQGALRKNIAEGVFFIVVKLSSKDKQKRLRNQRSLECTDGASRTRIRDLFNVDDENIHSGILSQRNNAFSDNAYATLFSCQLLLIFQEAEVVFQLRSLRYFLN